MIKERTSVIERFNRATKKAKFLNFIVEKFGFLHLHSSVK